MSRSKKLKPVVDIKVKATKDALLKVGEANAVWQTDKLQLEELQRYKIEYLDLFRRRDAVVMSAQKILELRGFLVQLDQAIQAQEQQVQSSYDGVKRQQALWLEARSKEQAIQSLVSRYQADENYQQEKQEQRDSDEHTNSQWLRKQ